MIRQIRLAYYFAALMLSCLLTAAAAVGVAGYMIESNNRTWCEYLTGINQINRETPPSTPTGKRIASLNQRQAERFNCEEDVK